MVAPLFTAVYILLEYKPSESRKIKLERVQRLTFKRFMITSKRTNTDLTNNMMRKDLRKMAKAVALQARGNGKKEKNQEIDTQLRNLLRMNGMRGVSNSWSKLVNTMVKPCSGCKTKGIVTSRLHLLNYYGIQLPYVNNIWKNEILPINQQIVGKTIYVQRMKITITKPRERESIKATLKPIIQKHIDGYYKAWTTILSQGKDK